MGLYGMRGPSGGHLHAIAGLAGDWVTLEVGKGTITIGGSIGSEPQVHTAPSLSTLREATQFAWGAYVHAADDVQWKEVAAAIAATCDKATLGLKPAAP